MPLATLCFSGFSRDDQAKATQLFAQANAEVGGRFELADEANARILVIDMDSMYGHMTWLKAQGSGKTTVGLTSGDRAETDYVLKSPMSAEGLRSLLQQLAAAAPAPAPTARPAAAPEPAAVAAEAQSATRTTGERAAFGTSILQQAAAARTTGQQQAMPRTTGSQAAMPPVSPRNTGSQPALPADEGNKQIANEYLAAMTTAQQVAMNAVPHEPRISDYLPSNILGGPVRLHSPGAPVLVLDPGTQTYAGSAALKPLLPYVEAVVRENQLEAISHTEMEEVKAASGGPQPYMRLLWLCGLVVGKGNLLPGYAANKKFVLTKWPQIEREFPKHFRLATVMMKGPAFVKDIAEQAGVGEAEAIDFVNAGIVTGHIVIEGTTTATGDVPKAAALLAKPRPA